MLYDTRADPGERDNVIAQRAQIAGELRALLAAYTDRAAASPLR